MKTGCSSLGAVAAFVLSLAFPVASASALPREETAERFNEVFADGSRICFLGDSITAGAQWCKALTDYFYTRFPDRRFEFFNAGVGGDKAKESILRLEEDVFVHRPDVVTVMFGMNDSNRYGGYVANPAPRHLEMRNKALDDYRETLPKLSDALAKGSPNAKICWFTPTPYDEFVRLDSPTRPGRAEALGRCAEIVRRHASARGDWICELNAPMSEYNEREREAGPSFTTLCGPDRVHPEAPGGFFMAQAILKSWGAPSRVSDVTIDAASGQSTASENSEVSAVSVAKGSVSFTVLEKSLPMPVAKEAKSVAEKTSFYETMNREYLRIKNLAPGNWTLAIDGVAVIAASSSQWSDGVNLSPLPTPQARQAEKVSALNERRIAAEKKVRRLAPARHFLRSHVRNIDDWEEVVRVAKSFEGQKEFPKALLPIYLAEWPSREKYLDEARKLADEIYASNRPVPHRYTLTSGEGIAATNFIMRIECGADWRPVEMGKPSCVQGKSVRIRDLEIVPGTALDLSGIVSQYGIDANGRIVSDSQGRLVFENAPERQLRLRGFNCTYGGKYDGFLNAGKKELEELAEQFRLMGMNFVRLHFFDAKFIGLNGLKWWQYRDVCADDVLPQTKEEIDRLVDRDFLDRFHWFVKCIRDRGVYIMFDVATSPNRIMARAKKSKFPTRIALFLDERWRKHWKAAFDFWTQTVNPYTGTRFHDDPQVIGLTFCNEQDWIFFSDQELNMFTPDFRKEFGENMPKISRRLLWEDGKASENARMFFRRRLKEMTDFYLGVVKASGFKGLTTQWDMLKTPLGAESHIGLSAVATHSYHAHPKFSVPLPDGVENERILEPWNKGKCTEVPFGSSLAENKRTYFANAALARTLGKPFLVTEYSHIPANDCAQEAPVVQSAIAGLQGWQALCPHSDLVDLWHYEPYPFFDESINLMARVSSVATAFGWQRGDIKSAPHAVSLSMSDKVLSSPGLSGSFELAYVNLAFMTRVGVDAENANNPLASLNIIPMREADIGKDEPLANDMQADTAPASQIKSHSPAMILSEKVVWNLREAGILPPSNRTNPANGLYESETGEILTNLRNETMTVDAPRFQAAALKPGRTARLSRLAVESVSTPASVLAISLDGDHAVSSARRVLLIIATRFMQEGAVVAEDDGKTLFIDEGPTYTQLMRTGRFHFSLETESKRVPKVYALRMNGTRAFTVPVELRDGRLFFDLDTSAFETATPFFEIVFPTAAPVIRDIPYDSGIGRAGLGTLYLPEKVEPSTPLVLCIHGGGWRTGSRSGWSGVAEFFRDELGFAAFNIEYRLAPTNRWPACGDDCVKAAKFVLSDDFKNSYGLSHDKIWICGGSSGGHLALWTLVKLSPDAVAGTVAISAIGDPEPDFRLHPDRYRALFGETVGKAEFAAMNPVLRVKPGMAPLLCTHATQDGVVPIASHRAFVDAYRAAGNRCELFEYGESSVPGIVGHRIWIPDSKPHKLIPEIEGAIRKFVQTKPW